MLNTIFVIILVICGVEFSTVIQVVIADAKVGFLGFCFAYGGFKTLVLGHVG